MKNKLSKKEFEKRIRLLERDPYSYFLKYENNEKSKNTDNDEYIFSQEEIYNTKEKKS